MLCAIVERMMPGNCSLGPKTVHLLETEGFTILEEITAWMEEALATDNKLSRSEPFPPVCLTVLVRHVNINEIFSHGSRKMLAEVQTSTAKPLNDGQSSKSASPASSPAKEGKELEEKLRHSRQDVHIERHS